MSAWHCPKCGIADPDTGPDYARCADVAECEQRRFHLDPDPSPPLTADERAVIDAVRPRVMPPRSQTGAAPDNLVAAPGRLLAIIDRLAPKPR